MRTTLDLPDETFRQLIERGLANREPLTVAAQQPQSPPVAIKRVPGSRPTPALTNAQLYALLEEEDAAQYQKVLNPSGSPQ